MNKFNLTARNSLDLIRTASAELGRRVHGFIRRESLHPHRGPQWQQLELPFSRTPVKRWNR